MTTLSYFFCEETSWPRQLTKKKKKLLIGGLQFQRVISSFSRSWQGILPSRQAWYQNSGWELASNPQVWGERRREERKLTGNGAGFLKPQNPPWSNHYPPRPHGLPRPHLILPKQFHQLGIEHYSNLWACGGQSHSHHRNDVENPTQRGLCHFWAGSPGLYKKVGWASKCGEHPSKQHPSVVPASDPASRFYLSSCLHPPPSGFPQ